MALADALDSHRPTASLVTVDGIQIPKVNEVSGLKSEVDKIELKQQTSDGKYVVRQLIGRPKPGEFTITRGLTDSKTITDWLKQVAEGDVAGARKTASVRAARLRRASRSRPTTSSTAGCRASRSTRSRPAPPSRPPRSSRSASTK